MSKLISLQLHNSNALGPTEIGNTTLTRNSHPMMSSPRKHDGKMCGIQPQHSTARPCSPQHHATIIGMASICVLKTNIVLTGGDFVVLGVDTAVGIPNLCH